MKKVAVVLAGSGMSDGSEIHEATLSLLALSKNNIPYQCFAPNRDQYHVVNHLTGEVTEETRNILVESARIARSNIKDLGSLNTEEYSGIIFPGGYGAAKNLSDFAFAGENYKVEADVAEVIKSFHSQSKPILALCIAPMLLAKTIFAKVTIGSDQDTAAIIEKVGGVHQNEAVDDICFDEKNLVITTACYMLADNIFDTYKGIEKAVLKLKSLID